MGNWEFTKSDSELLDEDLENIESSSESEDGLEVRSGLHFLFVFLRLALDEFRLALQLIALIACACSAVYAAAAMVWYRMLFGKRDMKSMRFNVVIAAFMYRRHSA